VFVRTTNYDEPGQPAPMGRIPNGAPDLSANGYGFDVPVVVGWRSTASVVQLWAGARGASSTSREICRSRPLRLHRQRPRPWTQRGGTAGVSSGRPSG